MVGSAYVKIITSTTRGDIMLVFITLSESAVVTHFGAGGAAVINFRVTGTSIRLYGRDYRRESGAIMYWYIERAETPMLRRS